MWVEQHRPVPGRRGPGAHLPEAPGGAARYHGDQPGYTQWPRIHRALPRLSRSSNKSR